MQFNIHLVMRLFLGSATALELKSAVKDTVYSGVEFGLIFMGLNENGILSAGVCSLREGIEVGIFGPGSCRTLGVAGTCLLRFQKG